VTRYPALVHVGVDGRAVVQFPDLPGCLAVGADAETALAQAEDALALHLDAIGADGQVKPAASAVGDLVDRAQRQRAAVALVAARPGKAPAVRVNVTFDRNLLAEIDGAAADLGTTRSGFLAEAARRLIGR
jgi:predicted RNase H-like HicB family nuclease